MSGSWFEACWRRRGLVGGVILALAAAPALGRRAPDARAPEAIPAGAYVLAPARSRVSFSVRKLFAPYRGGFATASGQLQLTSDDLRGSRVAIEIATASLEAPDRRLAHELRGPAWFDAGHFPTIRFVSTSMRRTGADTATIEGQITLHGVTRPMRMEARFAPARAGEDARTLGVVAHGVLQRSQFGVTTGIPVVGDEVTIDLSASFTAAG